MFLMGESIRHALFVDASLKTSNRANEKNVAITQNLGHCNIFISFCNIFSLSAGRFSLDAAALQLPDVRLAPFHRRTRRQSLL